MCGCLSHAPQWGTWPAIQACAPTGNRTSNPLPRSLALNPLSHTSQGAFAILDITSNTVINILYLYLRYLYDHVYKINFLELKLSSNLSQY